MITFVDSTKVKPKRTIGYCYIRAGFRHVGFTKSLKLHALQLTPDRFPEPEDPMELNLIDTVI